MPAADPRYGVANVSEEARDGWRAFCDRYGVDRNALAEVMGHRLGELTGDLPPVLRRWVREAQELRNERRRRG